MKKMMLPLAALCLLAASCSKNDTKQSCPPEETVAPNSETLRVKAYLDGAGISATLDLRGFYYKIITPGGEEKPTTCSTVVVNYKGTLTDGTTFDERQNQSFSLSSLIVGWKEGIPLIGKGGSIDLYLPPYLAYGSQARTGIPANSILVFRIDLISF